MDKQASIPNQCVVELKNHLQPELFKSLCDTNRVSIVAFLAVQTSPVTVGVLADQFGIDISGVSRHLKMLKDANVLNAEKQGREVYYSLNCGQLTSTLRGLADALDACCNN